VLAEADIAVRYAELKMQVRARTDGPPVLLREYFCPSCAAVLTVDLAVEGTGTLPTPVLGVR
jgi:N-methylhydantoinase B